MARGCRACLLCLLATLGGCASFADVEPGKLKAALCVRDVLQRLPQTKSVELYPTRHYRETKPVIAYEYRDPSGSDHFTYFEVTGDGPDDYLYVHPGNSELEISLPDNVSAALGTECHVLNGRVSVT